MRWAVAIACVVLLGCEGSPPAPPRGGEAWVVDFQSYAGEVEGSLGSHGLDLESVALRSLHYLETYYDGLPITFVPGRGLAGGKSYICVRGGEDRVLGRGILDLDNTTIDASCGERHGLRFGVFLDNIIAQIEEQGADATAERVARLLGVLLAHEIGHGLGLTHSLGVTEPGDIMTGAGFLDAFHVGYHFTDEHWDILERNLNP